MLSPSCMNVNQVFWCRSWCLAVTFTKVDNNQIHYHWLIPYETLTQTALTNSRIQNSLLQWILCSWRIKKTFLERMWLVSYYRGLNTYNTNYSIEGWTAKPVVVKNICYCNGLNHICSCSGDIFCVFTSISWNHTPVHWLCGTYVCIGRNWDVSNWAVVVFGVGL